MQATLGTLNGKAVRAAKMHSRVGKSVLRARLRRRAVPARAAVSIAARCICACCMLPVVRTSHAVSPLSARCLLRVALLHDARRPPVRQPARCTNGWMRPGARRRALPARAARRDHRVRAPARRVGAPACLASYAPNLSGTARSASGHKWEATRESWRLGSGRPPRGGVGEAWQPTGRPTGAEMAFEHCEYGLRRSRA